MTSRPWVKRSFFWYFNSNKQEQVGQKTTCTLNFLKKVCQDHILIVMDHISSSYFFSVSGFGFIVVTLCLQCSYFSQGESLRTCVLVEHQLTTDTRVEWWDCLYTCTLHIQPSVARPVNTISYFSWQIQQLLDTKLVELSLEVSDCIATNLAIQPSPLGINETKSSLSTLSTRFYASL